MNVASPFVDNHVYIGKTPWRVIRVAHAVVDKGDLPIRWPGWI